jgi:hypothetical protein
MDNDQRKSGKIVGQLAATGAALRSRQARLPRPEMPNARGDWSLQVVSVNGDSSAAQGTAIRLNQSS